MNGMKGVLWSVLLGMTFPAFSRDEAPETPQDYAVGMTLETTGESPWYRVPLPMEVYATSVWPDLRDVRVFNRQGDVVPFALEVQKSQATEPKAVPLRLFAFDASPVPVKPNDDSGTQTVLLRSKSGLEIHFESEDAKEIGQSFLLTLPENGVESLQVSRLRLDWRDPAENWQGKASVYYSRDLHRWDEIQDASQLMDLKRGDDRLKIDTLRADITLSTDSIAYLLVILDPQSPALILNGVSALTDTNPPAAERVLLNARGSKISPTEAIWQWDHPQPLTALDIILDNKGILPVELEWRSSEKEAWRPLSKTVLFWLDGQFSDSIPLSGALVEAVRMTTLNAKLPETLPVVRGVRDSYQVIFNAQGTSPYMLAWGNGAAVKADVSMDMLIPKALRERQKIDALPRVFPHTRVVLGGEARLTATSAAEQQRLWKTLLVWGALILGVAVLLTMAWRIWREVKKGGAA
ncbi:DUF3999 domain-containing protein [Citrobacter sp. R56]|uniref:DUF3999 domain-containing protein n=1 Tax=Citrobacter sp. R56 TaxID=1573676 RepID=UPI00193C5D90|nr:DUF3999 domain-containing protein [Citrobacter sp. R56]QRG78183.1 DUF3999 domain-containing protein [Citrobacter sp. R56]